MPLSHEQQQTQANGLSTPSTVQIYDMRTDAIWPELVFPADVPTGYARDIDLPAVITEGEENVSALVAVSRHGLSNSRRPHFLAVGLVDDWGSWDGWFTTDPLPSLSKLQWWQQGQPPRDVIVALNRKRGHKQLGTIASKLREKQAAVKIFAWPTSPSDVETISGLVHAVGPARFLLMLDALAKGHADIASLADALTVCEHFAKDAGGLLYVFDHGVYVPTGKAFVKRHVKYFLKTWGIEVGWESKLANEVTEYILADCPELWPAPPAHTINVANGLLEVNTRRLRPHSPDFVSPIQLPVVYDETAECPTWDWFVESVFPLDTEQLAFELVAWLMVPDTSIQKAVLLVGEGANGKSTYLAGLISFLGKRNCTALALQKLESDRFAAARLVGKLANICPDLPTAHLASTSTFKALTGGDTSNAERKYHDSFEFTSFCKLIFSANQPPQSSDSSHGFFRRWLVIPFEQVFGDGGESPAMNRETLDELLAAPTELSGLLNRALDALASLQENGFSESEATRRAWGDFRRETDPLAVWLDRTVIDDPVGCVAKSKLLQAYNDHCQERRRPGITKTAFGLAIKRLKPTIRDAQRTVDGKSKTDVYTGIRFKFWQEKNLEMLT